MPKKRKPTNAKADKILVTTEYSRLTASGRKGKKLKTDRTILSTDKFTRAR